MDKCLNCNYDLRSHKEKPTDDTSEDAIYSEVKNLVLRNSEISASMLQEEFDIRFASRLIDALEDDGVIEEPYKETIKKIKR